MRLPAFPCLVRETFQTKSPVEFPRKCVVWSPDAALVQKPPGFFIQRTFLLSVLPINGPRRLQRRTEVRLIYLMPGLEEVRENVCKHCLNLSTCLT